MGHYLYILYILFSLGLSTRYVGVSIHCSILLLQVPQLYDEECLQMLNHCLSLERRTLNSEQMETAVAALLQCPVPLCLQLMVKQLKEWKSYSATTEPIPTSIDGTLTHVAIQE